jgi:hypothetical protein
MASVETRICLLGGWAFPQLFKIAASSYAALYSLPSDEGTPAMTTHSIKRNLTFPLYFSMSMVDFLQKL